MVLRPCPARRGGHLVYVASVGGEKRHLSVHREVCRAFNGEPASPGLLALHRDGNPRNNFPCNLYWGTAKDNSDDMVTHGTRLRGEAHGRAKMTARDVLDLRSVGSAWPALAGLRGIGYEAAKSAVQRKTWRWLK